MAVNYDSKLLACVPKYSGPTEEWPAWRFSFEAFVGNQHERTLDQMLIAEKMARPILTSEFSAEDAAMSKALFFIITMVVRGPPLQAIMTVEGRNGFEAWRRLVQRESPSTGMTLAIRLLNILRFGCCEEKTVEGVEKLEHMIKQFEQTSGEVMGDMVTQCVLLRALLPSMKNELVLQNFSTAQDLNQAMLNLNITLDSQASKPFGGLLQAKWRMEAPGPGRAVAKACLRPPTRREEEEARRVERAVEASTHTVA